MRLSDKFQCKYFRLWEPTERVLLLTAIAFSKIFELYLKEDDASEGGGKSSKSAQSVAAAGPDADNADKNNGRLYDKAGKIKKLKHGGGGVGLFFLPT